MNRCGFREKTFVMTGGTRGIGRAIALAFAEAGAKVVVAARKANLLGEVVKKTKAGGGDALAFECDLTRRTDLHDLIQRSVESFQTIDILVKNAGISPFLEKS